MSKHIEVPSIGPGERVHAQGGSATVIVSGDVYEDARVTARGGSAKIEVEGYVHAHARLWAQGGGAKIIVKGGMHPSACADAQGGGSEVKISGKGPKDPPDRSGLEFGTYSFVPKRKRPDKVKGPNKVRPEPVDDHTEVTIQKSARPREQWGT